MYGQVQEVWGGGAGGVRGSCGGRLCRVVQKVWQELCGTCVSVVDLQCVNGHSSLQSLTTLGDLASHMMVVWTNEIQRNIDA